MLCTRYFIPRKAHLQNTVLQLPSALAPHHIQVPRTVMLLQSRSSMHQVRLTLLLCLQT